MLVVFVLFISVSEQQASCGNFKVSVAYVTGHFGKWHLTSKQDIKSFGCEFTDTIFECDYDLLRDSVKLGGFDTAEAVYVCVWRLYFN